MNNINSFELRNSIKFLFTLVRIAVINELYNTQLKVVYIVAIMHVLAKLIKRITGFQFSPGNNEYYDGDVRPTLWRFKLDNTLSVRIETNDLSNEKYFKELIFSLFYVLSNAITGLLKLIKLFKFRFLTEFRFIYTIVVWSITSKSPWDTLAVNVYS